MVEEYVATWAKILKPPLYFRPFAGKVCDFISFINPESTTTFVRFSSSSIFSRFLLRGDVILVITSNTHIRVMFIIGTDQNLTNRKIESLYNPSLFFRPAIRLVSLAIFRTFVSLGFCKNPVRTYDVGAPSSITISLPGTDPADAERRRLVYTWCSIFLHFFLHVLSKAYTLVASTLKGIWGI